MAAGVGSRFGGIKQLEPVGPSGEIILDYSLFDALSAGFSTVVFVIRREIEDDFRTLLGRHIEDVVDTRYAYQELDRLPDGFVLPTNRKKPWGTGHAILCCHHEVDGPFVAINADDFYGPTVYESLADVLGQTPFSSTVDEYVMAGYRLSQTLSAHGHVSRGVCSISNDGSLKDIRELVQVERRGEHIMYADDGGHWTELPDDTVASMNMWGFRPTIFAALEAQFTSFLEGRITDPKAELYIPSVVMKLVKEERARVDVIKTDERWVGVTYREDLPMVRSALDALVGRGTYPRDLRAALAAGQWRAPRD